LTDTPPAAPTPGDEKHAYWRGFTTAVGAPIMLLAAAFVFAAVHLWPVAALCGGALFAVGAAQAFWIVPLMIRARRRGEHAYVRGLLTAAGIILLLNGGCWGLVALPGRFR
jgi:hypothetical protein